MIILTLATHKIPYLSWFFRDDETDKSARTDIDDLIVNITYSTSNLAGYYVAGSGWINLDDSEIITTVVATRTITSDVLPLIDRTDKQLILPFTVESLAPTYNQERPDAVHILDIDFCDQAGHCTS